MMAEQNNRHSMPQSSQGFTFVSSPPERREPQRNYVFVDEKNRHRRLKVVRACEGCRKRKIRCDAANTNTWPCSACLKQKMTCIPPSLSFEAEDQFDTERDSPHFGQFQTSLSNDSPHHHQSSPSVTSSQLSYDPPESLLNRQHLLNTNDSFFHANQDFNQYDFSANDNDVVYPSIEQPYMSSASDHASSGQNNGNGTESDWRSETSDYELTEALGDLKISDTAVATYIINQKDLADAPAVQEEEIILPQQSRHDLIVRIPDAMMPFDTIALDYFRYFFDNIHPYVPVLYPPYFYRQWHRSKSSISPLILEGIFACSSYMMEQKTDTSNQWLALAAKHEESFRDVPRLSTLQGLLLLLKAREASPKRGYFYRSWMSCVNMAAMAKDLGLDTHIETHEMGRVCELPSHECIIRTRVWNTLYVVELLIGGPQGRSDYGVHSDTVDFDSQALPRDIEAKELQVSRQFSQLMRVVRNIRESIRLYASLRRKKTDWALDPEFGRHDTSFGAWVENLPQDFRVSFPTDESTPWVPSHFVANVHSYHRLAIIMHHRPKLQQTSSDTFDGAWKKQMGICYHAAKELCRLQEAVLQHFGLAGLLCMQRGISFTIYSVLTCTMLHLVAVTSPDTDVSSGAADYFARHMRLLEQCSPFWPMKEMQVQIDSLRQAFSADVNKPFELRANFPGSPPPRSDSGSQAYLPTPAEEMQLPYAPVTTSPTSNTLTDPTMKMASSDVLSNMHNGFSPSPSILESVEPQTYWNPSRIINQWNTAFGQLQQQPPQPPPAPPTSAPSMHQSTPPSMSPASHMGAQDHAPQFTPPPPLQVSSNSYLNYNQPDTSQIYSLPQVTSSPTQQLSSLHWNPTPQPYVTPSMWQHAVASAYKRRWNDTPLSMPDRDAKRMR